MRHCHPAARAVERVNGAGASWRADGTAIALSHGNQCDQST
jgi:hypothetical protein